MNWWMSEAVSALFTDLDYLSSLLLRIVDELCKKNEATLGEFNDSCRWMWFIEPDDWNNFWLNLTKTKAWNLSEMNFLSQKNTNMT